MASVNVRNAGRLFPPGTTVTVYAAGDFPMNWQRGTAPPAGASSVTTADVATDGSLAITGLSGAGRYKAYADVGGEHRYMTVAARSDDGEEEVISREFDDANRIVSEVVQLPDGTARTRTFT